MKNECPICESGNVPYVINDLQRLINIVFECTIVSTKYLHGRSNEEIADWTAKQLRDNGFDTQPMGSSWGVLKNEK